MFLEYLLKKMSGILYKSRLLASTHYWTFFLGFYFWPPLPFVSSLFTTCFLKTLKKKKREKLLVKIPASFCHENPFLHTFSLIDQLLFWVDVSMFMSFIKACISSMQEVSPKYSCIWMPVLVSLSNE